MIIVSQDERAVTAPREAHRWAIIPPPRQMFALL